MAGNDNNGDGKITLAVIGSQLGQLTDEVKGLRHDVRDLCEKQSRQEEFNLAVRHQLWNGSTSRVQEALNIAQNTAGWVRLLWIPLALAIAIGLVSILLK